MKDRFVKNFSTSCAVREAHRPDLRIPLMLLALLLTVVWLLAPSPAAGKKNKQYDKAMLINPFLGPEYARWLVGPVARIASDDEVRAFQALTDDAAAEKFVEEFWQKRRRPEGDYRKSLREVFEERVAEADHQFTEDSVKGSRSDRGTIHVLHGPPEEVDYEVAPWYGGPPIEVWIYPKDAPEGLDGEKPKKRYEFIEDEGRTVFYIKSYHDRKGRLKARSQPRFRP
jgi:GWxTD domain-containing protein